MQDKTSNAAPEISVAGWTEEPPDVMDPSLWGTLSKLYVLPGLPSIGKSSTRLAAGTSAGRPRPKGSAEKLVGSSEKKKRGSVRARKPTAIVERTPHLRLEKVAKREYRVSVYADTKQPDRGSQTQQIQVEVPEHIQRIQLEVWLHHSRHFKIVGGDTGRIVIYREKEESSTAAFRVIFTNRKDRSAIFLSAMFRYRQRPCGRVLRHLKAARDGDLKFAAVRKAKASERPRQVVLPRTDRAAAITIEMGAIKPDVGIEIVRTKENDGRHFRMKCFTPKGHWSGSWNLNEESKAIVKAHMDSFKNQTGPARIMSLVGAGMEFWEIVPPEVKTLLRDSIKANLIKTILVLSEEPYLPWELMVPDGLGDHGSLGATFDLGRWVTGDYVAPPQQVRLRTAFIIKPKSDLKHADTEAAFLKEIFGPDSEIDPATFEHVDTSLEAGGRDAIHFICHGKTAQLQTIRLNAPEVLTSAQVRAMKGFRKAFQCGPLAFLNACEVGSPVPSLVGVGGFANSFIQLGASAVVAPLWAVQDSVAYEISSTFYNAVRAGTTFAGAVREIRGKAYKTAIDSYAAYCFYGDPLARMA